MEKLKGANEFFEFLGEKLGRIRIRQISSLEEGWFGFSPYGLPYFKFVFNREYESEEGVYLSLGWNLSHGTNEDVQWIRDYLTPLRGVACSFQHHENLVYFQGYGGVEPDPRIVQLLEGMGLEMTRTTRRHYEYALKRGHVRILRIGPEAGTGVEFYQKSLITSDPQEATFQLDLMRQEVALFNTIKRSLV